jgi:hypothetical protein
MGADVGKEDEYDTFGQSITKKCRKLGESDRKAFLDLEFKIHTLVHEAEINHLDKA